MLRRDIDEIFINNYNSEFIVAWDANIDIQPVFDYYGTITYITDYWAKDSTGLTDDSSRQLSVHPRILLNGLNKTTGFLMVPT